MFSRRKSSEQERHQQSQRHDSHQGQDGQEEEVSQELQHQQQQQQRPSHTDEGVQEYFDLNVLKGAVSFNTKPFKHRALVWIGFKKVVFFPLCWRYWLHVARISRLRFLIGCALYILHNACTWLYIRGCLPQPREPPADQDSDVSMLPVFHVTQIEILLPYVIGALFGIGYGSVVAAGGWEALRIPSSPTRAGGHGDRGSRAGGGGRGRSVGAHGRSDEDCSNAGEDIPFADQVRARDIREEAEAEVHSDDDDLDDTESSSTGCVSDTEDIIVQQHRGLQAEDSRVLLQGEHDDEQEDVASVEEAGRQNLADKDVTYGGRDDDDGDIGSGAANGLAPVHFEAEPKSPPTGADSRVSATGRRTEGKIDVGGGTRLQIDVKNRAFGPGGGSSGQVSSSGVDVGSLEHIDFLAQPSYDSNDADDDEDEEEGSGGWGQVIVKPVKVAQWDKQGRRTKAFMSLNQLRALIIERAERTQQKATYRRAARLGTIATACLPALFTLWGMIAVAWTEAAADEERMLSPEDGTCPDGEDTLASAALLTCQGPSAGGGLNMCRGMAGTAPGCGRVEIETLVLAALCRAAMTAWALMVRVLYPQTGDGAAVAVTTISMCSVAFVALPTFRALEDSERTYQRRYMYSKYFGALTSLQRARKHRLPSFSLKNVANIRVWLALRAGKTWLRRHKRERSADAVVSMAFFLVLALLAAILTEALSNREARFLTTLVHWELLVWCCFISFFLLRYLTLGSNTNNRYRDTSVLLTEQINVQLRILQNSTNKEAKNKASKRERLGVSSKVLELATKLLKELDGPNKLSGLSMNPVLYNVTRVVLVSALSGVMSDTFGFSVKLYKVLSFK